MRLGRVWVSTIIIIIVQYALQNEAIHMNVQNSIPTSISVKFTGSKAQHCRDSVVVALSWLLV